MDASLTKSSILDHRDSTEVQSYFKRHFTRQPREELYRVKPDPDSLENLAANPEVATTLKELRNRLQQTMQATGDARLTDEYDKTPWVGPLKERKR